MRDLDRKLAPTFAAQLAVVTRRQVLAAGGSESAISRRLRNGAWQLAERGVYALSGVGWTWRRNLAAVVLSLRQAVASHRAAATLLGAHWDDRATPPIELSVPAGRTPLRDFELTRDRAPDLPIVVHERLDYRSITPWLIDGIPTTSPVRLAADLGAVVPFDQYRRAVAKLRRQHGVDWIALEKQYRRIAAQGRDGGGALHELLDRHFGEQGAPDEVVEIRCAELLRAAGLPAPVHQHEVLRPDGRRARFDLAYPELRIGIETEGRIHGDDDVRQGDHRRRNNVQLLGWTVFHFTWEDVMYRPDYVVQTVRAAILTATATAP